MRPPASLMAQLDPAQQTALVNASPLHATYATPVDRESAYEKLLAKVALPVEAQAAAAPSPKEESHGGEAAAAAGGVLAGVLGSSVFKSFARSAASAAGREISRSLFGTSKKRRR